MKPEEKMVAIKDKDSLWINLHEFSYAEYSSAVEMLQAAKRSKDIKLSKGFILHALDEYRHTNLIRSLISQYTKDNPDRFRDVIFCPNHAIKKGYINSTEFLFQKYNIQRFSVFIGINEQSACRIFSKLRKQCANILMKTDNISGDNQSYVRNVTVASKIIGEIIKDEMNHENLSLRYARKNITRWKLMRFLLWEKVSNRVRHFYASNKRVNKWVASFLYLTVIAIITPFRFVFSLDPPKMTNIVSKDNSDLML
jgi:hypothetical protein